MNRITKPRQHSPTVTRRMVLAAIPVTYAGLALPASTGIGTTEEIIRTNESIRHRLTLRAPRHRVYQALTEAGQFTKLTLLSAAVKSGMVPAAKAAELQAKPGTPFAIFGGHITGYVIELVPDTRIVQAWRPGDWSPGAYSIARFDLLERGAETELAFEHTGFPVGQAEHLATGWKENYWEPLAKLLA